jgi:hypothetical protein
MQTTVKTTVALPGPYGAPCWKWKLDCRKSVKTDFVVVGLDMIKIRVLAELGKYPRRKKCGRRIERIGADQQVPVTVVMISCPIAAILLS